jgi:ADP-heptose:LPS heptosyltransferase
MNAAPKSVLYIRPDTIGDLVIFSSALAQLQLAWPETRHTLLVRPGYDSLAPLFPPTLHWQVAPINPFAQRPSDVRPVLARLFEALEKIAPDLIVAPGLNRTWFEAAVAAHFPAARRVALGRRGVDPYFSTALPLDLGIESATVFGEVVPADERKFDWDNNHRIVDHLLERPMPRLLPSLTVPAEAVKRAGALLLEHNLPAEEFVLVFPGGLANVPIKAWPPERFARLIRWLQRDQGLPVLLAGQTAEAAIIETVNAHLVDAGGRRPPVWLGAEGELPLLAGLLAQSRCYVGNDTGAMHIAAAVGRPVVGIFGGGHWPRFRPVGRRVISVVQPLPCFGCQWDCHFGDAPCVKTIAPSDVIRAVDLALSHQAGAFDQVVTTHNLPGAALQLITTATPVFRRLQLDRMERLHALERLHRELAIKGMEVAALQREGESKDRQILTLVHDSNVKDLAIVDLTAALHAPGPTPSPSPPAKRPTLTRWWGRLTRRPHAGFAPTGSNSAPLPGPH